PSGKTNLSFNPEIIGYNDYYPFGMLVPNRHGQADSYRYGFQGQEKDDEVKGEGNSINYKFRMHDPRVGRFFAVDPLFREYPRNSPYAFSENVVVNAVELEGLEKEFYYDMMDRTQERTKTLKINGHKTLKGAVSGSLFKLGFTHYLPKKFVDKYTSNTGGTLVLSEQEMIDANPVRVGIQGLVKLDNAQFNEALESLKPGESGEFTFDVLNGSRTSGALGGFTTKFEGVLTKDANEFKEWSFSGVMSFEDEWNFEKHKKEDGKSYRSSNGDKVTTFARKYLSGKKFDIRSEKIKVNQTSKDKYVDWFKDKKPKVIPNRVYESKKLMNGVKRDTKE
ncbi:RHS repeat-associated core domain-containing protein, partial [Tenacibaculum maritimum]|uniref:RHS repeat domain-containing protein n=1 Tax=Tenacibaculum maritimum TaxID=107401 RepID=UPI00293E6559